MTLQDTLESLLLRAESSLSPESTSSIRELQARLRGPLRVAIAGRVKAGKSTLLNALVGERLAPTDASECTRVVTWYSYGEGYDISCELPGGERTQLRFTRDDGRLDIEMAEDLAERAIRIDVSWPSTRLRDMTVIDTPGLASATAGVSERTEAAIVRGGVAARADAVIYLLRHVHASDVAFLESFLDEQTSEITPVNSVGVLSRADEVGAGRADAMESAKRIADRYAHDSRIRSLVSAVVPVAGLLAETAATLEEREAESLRALARAPLEVTTAMLLSADRFRLPDLGPLTVEIREALLQRFGLFGVRLAVSAFRNDRWQNGSELARLLTEESGVGELQDILRRRFAGRARQLVARTVLESLRKLVDESSAPVAAGLARDIEEIEASAHEIAELRMLDLVWSGVASFTDGERAEAERVAGTGDAGERSGCGAHASLEDVRSAALAGVVRWRERAGDVFADRETLTCCETMARSYEGLYAEAR